MSVADAERKFYAEQLGVTGGSLAELKAKYFKALSAGDIAFASQEDLDDLEESLEDLEERVTALEPAGD